MTETQLSASILDPIIDEVSRDAGVPREQVRVMSAEAMTFPNAGLGCEQPGIAYAQVQIDGYRVLLEAGGNTYDYRGAGSRPPRRCLKPAP